MCGSRRLLLLQDHRIIEGDERISIMKTQIIEGRQRLVVVKHRNHRIIESRKKIVECRKRIIVVGDLAKRVNLVPIINIAIFCVRWIREPLDAPRSQMLRLPHCSRDASRLIDELLHRSSRVYRLPEDDHRVLVASAQTFLECTTTLILFYCSDHRSAIIVPRTMKKTNVTCCGYRNPDSRGMSTTRMCIEHCVSYV